MSKRIITTYDKLGHSIKRAIDADNPYGIEERLTRMKHLIKGYFFDGFIYEYQGVTYLVEWSKLSMADNVFAFEDEDDYDEDNNDDIDFDAIETEA